MEGERNAIQVVSVRSQTARFIVFIQKAAESTGGRGSTGYSGRERCAQCAQRPLNPCAQLPHRPPDRSAECPHRTCARRRSSTGTAGDGDPASTTTPARNRPIHELSHDCQRTASVRPAHSGVGQHPKLKASGQLTEQQMKAGVAGEALASRQRGRSRSAKSAMMALRSGSRLVSGRRASSAGLSFDAGAATRSAPKHPHRPRSFWCQPLYCRHCRLHRRPSRASSQLICHPAHRPPCASTSLPSTTRMHMDRTSATE
jgi:hypothetical protein